MDKKIVLRYLILIVLPILYYCSAHPYQQGKRLFEIHCQRCHGPSLEGFEELYPPINESPYILQHQPSLACIIQHGSNFLQSHSNSEDNVIPMPENHGLNAVEILNIVNYIYYSLDIDYTEKITTIESALEECKNH
ncbi:c-type cytochrome [Membranihabitans marinus]|uniref:c-type cytochrome n=1 Tax=Membranihabitans marinus TaxID=1227546 RepID=UPI001F3F72E9|nr:cytochrome c [Membranihabitans marinus]